MEEYEDICEYIAEILTKIEKAEINSGTDLIIEIHGSHYSQYTKLYILYVILRNYTFYFNINGEAQK